MIVNQRKIQKIEEEKGKNKLRPSERVEKPLKRKNKVIIIERKKGTKKC